MIRYLSVLVAGGFLFLGMPQAWAQKGPDAAPPGKAQAQDAGQQETGKGTLKNPFEKPTPQETPEAKPVPQERYIFKELPKLKLKGLIRLKGKETAALLQVGEDEVFRVRKGDIVRLTLPGEAILVMGGPESEPEPGATTEGQNKGKQGNQKNSDEEGENKPPEPPRPRPIPLKELQVILEIVAVDRNGLEIKAIPYNESIMVR